MWQTAAGMMVAAGLALAALAAYVWRRRGVATGLSLAALLLSVAWWGLAYAIELSTGDLGARERWGDLKYAGVSMLAPAWLTFVLLYTGRGRLVTRRLLLALTVEPVLVLAVLAVPATHDLVRSYPPGAADEHLPVVETGPLFWVHFAYTNVLILVATVLFVVSVGRVSRMYWRLSLVLVASALLPWAANLLHNFEVGAFAKVDLTPFAFTVTGAVLVWGLYRDRLLDLAPVARSQVVESMADGLLVVDVYGRLVDANPAAARILGRSTRDLQGLALGDLLSGQDVSGTELTLPVDGEPRHFDARRQPLSDHRGKVVGELLVLRDVTDRTHTETQLRQVLVERSRIASALQASLLPAALPAVPGLRLAARYSPAGDGREIGGDFYDVFPLGGEDWAVVLGDVSGKGAEAAAVTALIRYTLRTLATVEQVPSRLLAELNTALLRDSVDERYCTLAYLRLTPRRHGVRLTLCLAGHHAPLIRRADGTVTAAGRSGTALGLVAEPDLFDAVLDLAPGDLLCLFTDGLVEARRGHELFGEAGAVQVLRSITAPTAEQVATGLEEAARTFRGGPLGDDMALLVMECAAAERIAAAPWLAQGRVPEPN